MIYLLFILTTGWSITSKDRLFFRNMLYDIRPNALFILKKDYQLILVLAHFGNLILLKEKKLENQFPSNLFLINESKVNRCSFYQNQKEIEYHLRDSLQLVVTPSMSYRDSRFWKKSRMQSVRFFFLKKKRDVCESNIRQSLHYCDLVDFVIFCAGKEEEKTNQRQHWNFTHSKSLKLLINVHRNKIDYLLLIEWHSTSLWIQSSESHKIPDRKNDLNQMEKMTTAATTATDSTWKRNAYKYIECRARVCPISRKEWRVFVQLMSIFHVFHYQHIFNSLNIANDLYLYIQSTPWWFQPRKTQTTHIDFSFHFWRHHNFHVRKQYMFMVR